MIWNYDKCIYIYINVLSFDIFDVYHIHDISCDSPNITLGTTERTKGSLQKEDCMPGYVVGCLVKRGAVLKDCIAFFLILWNC